MPLSEDDRAHLLAEPLVAVVSVDSGSTRGPVVAPVWYAYQPGGDAVLFTGADSRKARLIRRAGRFSLLVQRTSPTYRYVTMEGPASFRAVTEEVLARVASRYLPGDAVDGYVARSMAEQDALTAVALTPEHWASADLGPSS